MDEEHKTEEREPTGKPIAMAPTVKATIGAPKLQRGMKLRSALSGFGIIKAAGELSVYIIAFSPRGSGKFWRVFRRYLDFKFVRQQLLDQVGLHLMVSTVTCIHVTWSI